MWSGTGWVSPYMSSCGIYSKNISNFTIRRGSQVVYLDRIVGNVLPGACLKTNGVVCYYSFLHPKCEAVFVIGSWLIPLTVVAVLLSNGDLQSGVCLSAVPGEVLAASPPESSCSAAPCPCTHHPVPIITVCPSPLRPSPHVHHPTPAGLGQGWLSTMPRAPVSRILP